MSKGESVLCSIIILLIAIAMATVSFLHISPSLPSFALQSFTPAADNHTITPQNWQLSFFLRNTNTFSLRCPAKDGAVSYDHISARLLLRGAHSFTLSHNASTPFDHPAGQLSFPGNGTAAATGSCTAEEAAYSGLSPCRTVRFCLEWKARVRFGGTTRASRKVGVVNVVCKDVTAFVSEELGLPSITWRGWHGSSSGFFYYFPVL